MNSMTRERSRAMVTPNRIVEIAKDKLPRTTSFDQAGSFGISCYESGMIEVLRGVAMEDLEYGMGPILMTVHTKKYVKQVIEKSEELRNTLDGPTFEIFKEFEEVQQNLLGAETSDHFIEGFIRGYRYLKNQMEFGDYNAVREGAENE